jgi:phosphoribosylglycinamide formyltransferase 1
MNVGVLVSGNGTNLQALIDAQARGELGPGRLTLVGANVPGCAAIGRAERAGVPCFVLDHRAQASRAAFDQAMAARLREAAVELVVLAGFMRILTADFVQAHAGRMINIHPALLPAFPGLHPQRQALDHGVKFSGCTVHFVEEGTDTGPIIAQAIVPVLEGDDVRSLSQRIFAEEHRLLPAVVRAIAEGRVSLEGRRVRVAGSPASGAAPDSPFAVSRLRSL